jgi:hypothetical protein
VRAQTIRHSCTINMRHAVAAPACTRGERPPIPSMLQSCPRRGERDASFRRGAQPGRVPPRAGHGPRGAQPNVTFTDLALDSTTLQVATLVA